MTEPGTPTGRPSRAAHGLLAALVGLALVLAGILVGAVPAAAGNRVGASTPVMINTVGVSTDIGAGQRLGKTVLQPTFVVATAVAADTGGGGTLSRLRSMNWADDTGAVTVPGRSESKLIYEANPKHGPVPRPGPRGEISRAPRGDCQAMLECSTLTGPRIREGIEPETGLQVIFRQHREFEGTEWWHGYVPGG